MSKPVTRSTKAGLTLSVSRVDNVIRAKKFSTKYSNECPVFVTGVIEYLVKEIITSSAKEDTKRIQPKSLATGLANDLNLCHLFEHTEIGNASFI
jgi:hypothetical protein